MRLIQVGATHTPSTFSRSENHSIAAILKFPTRERCVYLRKAALRQAVAQFTSWSAPRSKRASRRLEQHVKVGSWSQIIGGDRSSKKRGLFLGLWELFLCNVILEGGFVWSGVVNGLRCLRMWCRSRCLRD